MKVTQHTAKTDLYRNGLRIPADNKQKYKLDRSKPADKNDEIVVPAGSKYFSWKRKNQQRTYSLTDYVYVKPYNEWDEKSQEFRDAIEELDIENEEEKDELTSQIEEYRDELQERLDNIPEQLQESSVLNERIEELDNMLNEIS